MTGRGLVTQKQQNEDNFSGHEDHLAIIHEADIVDQATGQAYSRLRFPTASGGQSTLDVRRGDLVKPTILLSELLNNGAIFDPSSDRKIMLELVQHAASQQPRFICEYVGQSGWQHDLSYASKDKVISRGKGAHRLLPPRQEGRPVTMKQNGGNQGDWTRDVAVPCCHSQIGIFMLAVGFAPPLLELLNLPSFGINLCGPSKKGKSTLLLGAASIYGARVESDLTNFATTYAAVGEACRLHNSALLPLNEAGLIKGDRRQAYKVIRPCIFQLTEGREFARHSKSGFAVAGDLSKYRLIFAAMSEHPMSFYAAEAGQVQDDGELARCFDVYVLFRNRTSVVDRNLRHVKVGKGETIPGKVLKAIRVGCERSGGAVPILDFVRRIMDGPENVRREIERLQASFIAQAVEDHFDDIDRHRAMCFGAIVAAGQLACRWGFIPISERRMLEIVRRVFSQVCHTRVRIADAIMEGKERLRARLTALPDEDDRAARLSDAQGYRRRSEGGEILYYVHEASFKEWFDDRPADYIWIMKWLKDRDALKQVQSHVPTDVQSYSHTPMWPSGKRVRCIILRNKALLRSGDAGE